MRMNMTLKLCLHSVTTACDLATLQAFTCRGLFLGFNELFPLEFR